MPKPKALTLYVRNLDAGTARAIKRGAQSRGLTIAEYLDRWAALHADLRARADGGDSHASATLRAHKLGTVTA